MEAMEVLVVCLLKVMARCLRMETLCLAVLEDMVVMTQCRCKEDMAHPRVQVAIQPMAMHLAILDTKVKLCGLARLSVNMSPSRVAGRYFATTLIASYEFQISSSYLPDSLLVQGRNNFETGCLSRAA